MPAGCFLALAGIVVLAGCHTLFGWHPWLGVAAMGLAVLLALSWGGQPRG